jgi:hypothetical protein
MLLTLSSTEVGRFMLPPDPLLGGELLGGRVEFLLQLIVPFSELHVGLVLVDPEADGAD